jgi:hypothetical protein
MGCRYRSRCSSGMLCQDGICCIPFAPISSNFTPLAIECAGTAP